MSTKAVGSAVGTLVWVAGWILAKGFWMTTAAVLVPFVSAYIVIKKLLQVAGWV